MSFRSFFSRVFNGGGGGGVKVPTRDEQKATLVTLLSHSKYEFRTFARLMRAVNGNAESTRSLLLEIGTRTAGGNDNLYGLTSRVGATRRRRASYSRGF